jgi:tetratricopeptide (TPR) repeat protein
VAEFAQSLIKKLHIINPYEGFDYKQFPVDLSGGGFQPGFILPLMEITHPQLIIEVGSWKGSSAVQMAAIMRNLGIDGAVICVDTWLGGLEHILNTDPIWGLSRYYRQGYPTIYYQFLANVMQRGLQDYIVPFPNTSNIAARWLIKNNIGADLIFIDGSHDEEDVKQDLANYWKVLKPGGVIFGDDYHSDWSGVVNAVDWFAQEQHLVPQVVEMKWILAKPSEEETEFTSPETLKRTAMEAYARGDYDRSEQAFRLALARSPQDVNLLVSLGKLCFDLGKYDEASKNLQMAIQLQPDDQDALTGLTLIRERQRKPEQNLDFLKHLLSAEDIPTFLQQNEGGLDFGLYQTIHANIDNAQGELREKLCDLAIYITQALARQTTRLAASQAVETMSQLTNAGDLPNALREKDLQDKLNEDLMALIYRIAKQVRSENGHEAAQFLENMAVAIRQLMVGKVLRIDHRSLEMQTSRGSIIARKIASKYTSGRIPIAMPTYNRPHYIRQVFNALRECDNLEFFMLVTCEEPAFPEVAREIETVDFMPVERHLHHTRWGCSRNVCSAINYAFQHGQVAIILEDDIVPAKDFLNYMLWGLDTFQGDPRVIAIGGYQMLKVPPDPALVNVAQKITWLTPWGWATWKDRWERFYQTRLYLAPNPTWDAYFNDFMFGRDGIEIVPSIGRTQNIGEQGVNVPSAEWQRENQQTPYWHGNGSYPTVQPDEFTLGD